MPAAAAEPGRPVGLMFGMVGDPTVWQLGSNMSCVSSASTGELVIALAGRCWRFVGDKPGDDADDSMPFMGGRYLSCMSAVSLLP